MPEEPRQIKVVAFEARRAFEERTIPRPLLRNLYFEYNPHLLDTDVFLDVAADIFPVSSCSLATVYLRHLLGEGELVEGWYYDEPHQFLGLGKLVADITADQFGGPKVYVGPAEEPWARLTA
jgi:hypothetical protein